MTLAVILEGYRRSLCEAYAPALAGLGTRTDDNVAVPVLMAVDGKGISTDLEDFDTALLGHHTQCFDQFGTLYHPTFDPDGLFARGKSEPTISGVLAFTEVGVLRCSEPVLYVHPRFEGHLPDALQQLERRTLGAEGILIQEAVTRGLLEELGFIDPDS